jgi:hypothetical protein
MTVTNRHVVEQIKEINKKIYMKKKTAKLKFKPYINLNNLISKIFLVLATAIDRI